MSIAVYVHVGVKIEDNDDSSYTITHVPNPTFFASLGRTTLAHSLFFFHPRIVVLIAWG